MKDIYIHVFLKTTRQFAIDGEQISQEVAKDVGVGAKVMMTCYVRKEDPHLHRASNETFRRIAASLPPEVAKAYGRWKSPDDSIKARLEQALVAQDWEAVAKLLAELARRQAPPGAE